jgi:FtsZ-binding cell division protein ZapB
MNRQEITSTIKAKYEQIEVLQNEIIELKKQGILLSDEQQQYYEKEVEVEISKRPKVTEKQLHGLIKWKEYFKDEDRPDEPIEIERNMLVRVNGDWL